MIETDKFWYDEENGEINIESECKYLKINCGHNQTIHIEKLYAPTIFCDIRITPVLETCTWKIERQKILPNDKIEWETICEFDAQECLSFNNK